MWIDSNMGDGDFISHTQVNNGSTRNSLAVQWLGLHPSIAGDTGSIPGRGTTIPRVARPNNNNNNNGSTKGCSMTIATHTL